MPNKHKNRAKQRVPDTGLRTPPATPTSIQTQTSFQRLDPRNKEATDLPTPPPTPGCSVIDDLAPPTRSSQVSTPSIDDMTISVLPRATSTFSPPAYDVLGEYGGLIPVNYFRWPLGTGNTESDYCGEILYNPHKWGIGYTMLRSRLAGSWTTRAKSRLDFMAGWLYIMECSALDVGYDLEAWTECCRKTWAAFMSEDAGQVYKASIDRELRKYGRVAALGRAYDAETADARNGQVLADPPPTPPLIQHRSVYASGRVVEMHPIHGPLHHQLPAQDELQTEMIMIRDCNSLCTVVDINNKLKLRPEPFVPLPREAALAHYAKYPIKDHVQSVPPINTTIVSIEGEPVWTSVKPLAELQELLVKDLLWPKRHVGRSLLCRVLTRCEVESGIAFLVEDSESQVIPVTVMFPLPLPALVYPPSVVQGLWPIGTCLYIKEPYARMGAKGRTEIAIAWPKDMIEVPRVAGIFDHPAVTPASTDLGAYRLAAAVAFAQNKVKFAIRLASIGLNLASLPRILKQNEDNQSHLAPLLVGRALAHWINNQPGAAYSDCLQVEEVLLSSNPIEPSLLWRRVKFIRLQAAYKLRMFAIAKRHFVICEHLGVHSSVLEPYREAIELRIGEMKGVFTGETGSALLGPGRAMYQGPIKVVLDPVKGRTVVTSRAVKSGEVLMVESPMVGLDFNGAEGVNTFTVRWGTETIKQSCSQASWTVHQIMDDPSIGQCIHSLAPNANIAEKNIGITDDERLEVFRNPREIEVDLLERQIGRNAFGGHDGKFSVYGLGSMISHSCKSNTLKADFGQAQSIKAINDMAEGEEIFTNYVDPHRSFESRHGALLRNWYFDCNCSLCQADKTPGDRHQPRTEMMVNQWPSLEAEAKRNTFERNAPPSSLTKAKPTIARLTAFAAKIDATYARGRSAKLELSLVVLCLADLWAPFDATQAVKCYMAGFRHLEWEFYTAEEMKESKKAVRRFGFVDIQHVMGLVKCLMAMRDLHLKMKQPHVADAVLKSLEILSNTLTPPALNEAQIKSWTTPPKVTELDSSDLTDEIILGADLDSALDVLDKLKPGERVDGPLSPEQLKGMFKEVTMPNGEKAMQVDLKGTPMEGHEEAFMKQFVELERKFQARQAGSSSRSG